MTTRRTDVSEPKDKMEEARTQHYHRVPPVYYPHDDGYDIELDPDTYKPRDLLNYSVKSFWCRDDDDLSIRHLNARKGFCARIGAYKPRFDVELSTNDGNGNDGTNNIVNSKRDAQIERAGKDVNVLKRFIDEFFFFGQLRNQIDLNTGIDVVKPLGDGKIMEGWNGYTELRAGRCRLRINVGTGDRLFPLIDVIETLVHEMAHAYLLVFSVKECDLCERARLSTVGLPGDGHGPIFLELHRIMITTIRMWDDNLLRDLAAQDCPGGSQASKSARELCREAQQKMTPSQRALYGRKRRLIGEYNSLIRLTEGGDVIVSPALKDKTIKAEDERRAKILRRKRLEEELVQDMRRIASNRR